MATIGLPNSFSWVPVARHSARAPAACRPTVVTRERRGITACSLGLGLGV